MLNHHNPKYDTGIPIAVGDRYYAQDMFRDMRYYQFNLGQTIEKLAGGTNLILDGLVVTQGTGHTIDITAGMGIVPFTVTILNRTDTWAKPPNTETVDINMFPTIETGLVNQDISGANDDGGTPNYVKLAYAEDDQNTRVREKKAGSYSYEVQPSYIITVNDTTPTNYEITLATFTTNGTDITFTYGDSPRLTNLSKLSKYQEVTVDSLIESNTKYLASGASIDLTLPSNPIVGDTVDAYSLNIFNNIIPNDDQVIFYNDTIFTQIGSFGELDLHRSCHASLIYTGEETTLTEIFNYTISIDVGDLPPDRARKSAFSPSRTYLAVTHSTGDYITIYSISDNTFSKIANPAPADLPLSASYGIDFSPDSSRMAVGSSASPFINIYNATAVPFTRITDPVALDLPSGTVYSVAYSPDGSLLACAHAGGLFLTIYNATVTPYARLAGPDLADIPTGTGRGVAFSPDGSLMAVAHDNSPTVTIYQVSGSGATATFAKLTGITGLTTSGRSIAFSPDGNFLALGTNGGNYFYLYAISGTNFIANPNPATMPVSTVLGVSFSHDSRFLAVGHSDVPYIYVYSIFQNTFTLVSGPTASGNIDHVTFSPTSTFLSTGFFNSPYITIYKNLLNNENVWRVLDISPKNGEDVEDLFS